MLLVFDNLTDVVAKVFEENGYAVATAGVVVDGGNTWHLMGWQLKGYMAGDYTCQKNPYREVNSLFAKISQALSHAAGI